MKNTLLKSCKLFCHILFSLYLFKSASAEFGAMGQMYENYFTFSLNREKYRYKEDSYEPGKKVLREIFLLEKPEKAGRAGAKNKYTLRKADANDRGAVLFMVKAIRDIVKGFSTDGKSDDLRTIFDEAKNLLVMVEI